MGGRRTGRMRTGGLGIRDLRATAALLEVPEWNAALLIEVARAADLLAADGEWLPTHAYDFWRLQEVPQRWITLVTAWLDSDRVAGLAGARDDNDRPINVLGDEVIRGSAPHTRHAVMATLANGPRARSRPRLRARPVGLARTTARRQPARTSRRLDTSRGRSTRRHRTRRTGHALKGAHFPLSNDSDRLRFQCRDGAGESAAHSGRPHYDPGRPHRGGAWAADHRPGP